MSKEILSQDEISALLDSVASDPEESTPVASAGAKSVGRTSSQGETKYGLPSLLFPLVKAQAITRDAQATLGLIFDTFAHKGSSTLATTFRVHAGFALSEGGFEHLRYSEEIELLPEPSSIWYLRMKPTDFHLILCFEPILVHAIIAVLLGGKVKSEVERNRNVTDLEQSVMESMVQVFSRELQHAWSRFLDVEIEVENRETRPRLLQIYPPNEAMALAEMTMKLGANEGVIYWSMPIGLVKLLQSKASQQNESESQKQIRETVRRMKARMAAVPAQLEMLSSPTMVSFSDLMRLNAGDVLRLDHRLDEALVLEVNGSQNFRADLVSVQERKAAQIR